MQHVLRLLLETVHVMYCVISRCNKTSSALALQQCVTSLKKNQNRNYSTTLHVNSGMLDQAAEIILILKAEAKQP